MSTSGLWQLLVSAPAALGAMACWQFTCWFNFCLFTAQNKHALKKAGLQSRKLPLFTFADHITWTAQIKKMTATKLPPLPENEKNYAGIPEAVFVVSTMISLIKNNLKSKVFASKSRFLWFFSGWCWLFHGTSRKWQQRR